VTRAEARRTGRPRSEACDRAILDAALEEYAERGFDGMRVDSVAARAGVSKATIYRRYPSKVELVVSAAYEISDERVPFADTGSTRGDLRAGVGALRDALASSALGRSVRMVVGDLERHEDFARLHSELVRRRRQAAIAAIRRGVARGDLRTGIDEDLAVDVLSGPLFYRHMVSRMPLDDAYLDALVDSLLASFGATSAR
jgi:AcrR family transcriptional regulator